MSGSKGQEVYNQLSVTLYNEGFHDHATDIALIDAALRAAKVEGLKWVEEYCRKECHVDCAGTDFWQCGHNAAAYHIANTINARIAELEREGEQHG